MKQKHKILIGIGSAVLIGLGTYFVGKRQGWWGSSPESDGSILDNVGAVVGIIDYKTETCKSFPIKKGSKCKAVYLLQKEINKNSTTKIAEDGIWGKNTDKYLKEVRTKLGFMASYNLDNLVACGKLTCQSSTVDNYLSGSSSSSPIGKVAYVKKDFVNLRTSPKVNDGWISNKAGEIKGTNTKIGKVIAVKKEVDGGYKNFYQIDMVSYCCRYVREDVVTLKNK